MFFYMEACLKKINYQVNHDSPSIYFDKKDDLKCIIGGDNLFLMSEAPPYINKYLKILFSQIKI